MKQNNFCNELYFLIFTIYRAFLQVVFQLWDQTHYHRNAFFAYAKILFNILATYFIGIPNLFITHVKHALYLKKIGFEDNKTLTDNGSLVWTTMPDQGNTIGQTPAKCVTGFKGNISGNHSHMSIAGSSLQKMWLTLKSTDEFSFENTIFVDFGCGTGLAVLAAMTQPFLRVVGVELDISCASICRRNIDLMVQSESSTIPVQCQRTTILQVDMSDFYYSSLELEPNQTIVLYMYEPLWTIQKADASVIYHRILQRAQACGHPVLVAYFFEGIYNGDALPALNALGAKLLVKWRYDSLNFASEGDFYLYKLV